LNSAKQEPASAGARFRLAVAEGQPLQVVGAADPGEPDRVRLNTFLYDREVRDANVDIALYCCGAYRAMNAAALNFYQTVLRDGTQKAAVEAMQSRADLYQYLGCHAYEDKLDALSATKK
jgi:2-methylisocitrate lyase-like PEP mutase family enzyme